LRSSIATGLLGYNVAFLAATHLFVAAYEELTLQRTFGLDYAQYCASVG
jgi:protein-S-isoprenylcysteine O-methyltransferase Ste14